MFDYETLRVLWWLLLGLFVIGFAITNGMDFGVCALLPILGRNDWERRLIINTVGGTWEGNQVWLIAGGANLFAVWPLVYATLFSGLYLAVMLVLFALFLRPAGFDFRSKLESPLWRRCWDWGLCVGGLVPALLMGVVVGNLLQGLPFRFDADLRSVYTGTLWGLLNPFALLCGLTGLALLLLHGAIYLQWRAEGPIYLRARHAAGILGTAALVGLGIVLVWLIFGVDGHSVTAGLDPAGPSNPLTKTVEANAGGWMRNFVRHPWMLVAPLLAFAGTWFATALALEYVPAGAFLANALGMAGALLSAGFAMYPFVLPSSIDAQSSLTLWDASASRFTLELAFWITLLFLPLVMAYTAWVYRVLWGPLSVERIRDEQHELY